MVAAGIAYRLCVSRKSEVCSHVHYLSLDKFCIHSSESISKKKNLESHNTEVPLIPRAMTQRLVGTSKLKCNNDSGQRAEDAVVLFHYLGSVFFVGHQFKIKKNNGPL
jgi:hypothetical protein